MKSLHLLDILYPPVCMLCGKLLETHTGLCKNCKRKVELLREPLCMRCGKPLLSETEEYCPDCAQSERWFDGGRGVFPYRSAMQKAVLDLKSQGKRENARFLGRCMAASIRPLLSYWQIRMIVPVPLDPAKLRKRGYNQAGLLAGEIGRCLHLPVDEGLLKKRKGGTEQKKLHRFARKRSQQGLFYVKTGKLPDTVLLVDDIYTTGSTIEAAARTLKEAGVQRVFFVTACMGSDLL